MRIMTVVRRYFAFQATTTMNKVVANAEEALRGIADNMTLMVGGFGLCGIPENSINALVKRA
jgi:acyl CoA:acetate/3-ketoacid CoA transferase alpha subunit